MRRGIAAVIMTAAAATATAGAMVVRTIIRHEPHAKANDGPATTPRTTLANRWFEPKLYKEQVLFDLTNDFGTPKGPVLARVGPSRTIQPQQPE